MKRWKFDIPNMTSLSNCEWVSFKDVEKMEEELITLRAEKAHLERALVLANAIRRIEGGCYDH